MTDRWWWGIKKARKSWARLTRILGQEGAEPRISRVLFKVVVQLVLIFESEMWVLTPCREQALGSFQHKVTQRMTRRKPSRRG